MRVRCVPPVSSDANATDAYGKRHVVSEAQLGMMASGARYILLPAKDRIEEQFTAEFDEFGVQFDKFDAVQRDKSGLECALSQRICTFSQGRRINLRIILRHIVTSILRIGLGIWCERILVCSASLFQVVASGERDDRKCGQPK
jgi:hypothetical protein